MSDQTGDSRKSKHADLGTFVVRMQHHQNSTFQGTVTWVEEDRTSHFRSTWELVRMIEDGLADAGKTDPDELPDWGE